MKLMKSFLLFFGFIVFLPLLCRAQSELTLDKSYLNVPISSALESISDQKGIKIFYKKEWFESKKIEISGSGLEVVDFLNQNLESEGFHAVSYYGTIVLLSNNPVLYQEQSSASKDLIVIGEKNAKSNEVVFLSGVIMDGATDEALIGARIYVKSLNIGTITDFNGKFTLKLPVGKYSIDFSSISYESKTIDILLRSAGDLNVDLFSGSLELDELVITANAQDANVQQRVAGVQNMNIETIRQLPTFMGEVDPVKSLTTMPGISTTGELSSGFNVRGGETGQNLILQDGAVVYNPTHLFGFYSAFNADMVSEVNLYKGGGPANYGGRVSSVLDLKLRQGSDDEYKVYGGIGLVSSRLTAEGPIIKNKASFLIGGRTSYTNWLLHSLNNIELNNSSAMFYDVNAKLLYRLGKKDYVTASFYISHDDFSFSNEASYNWGTTNFSAEWNHVFGPRSLSTLTVSSSDYTVKTNAQEDEQSAFKFNNGIKNFRAKYEFLFKINSNNTLSAGLDYYNHDITPGKIDPMGEISTVLSSEIPNQSAHEISYFLQDDFNIGPRLAVSLGARLSSFYRVGPDKVLSFEEGEDVSRIPNAIDSTFYQSGELIESFYKVEPRVSFRYLLATNSSLKMSYYRSYQYLHLISNTVSATPQDFYLASGPNLAPQYADQYSVGYFRNSNNNGFEFSGEIFYKKMYNSVDFLEGAEILGNEELEGSLVQGSGKSYGIELQIKKNLGRLSGWASYTYSRSLKRFNGNYSYQIINNGEYYGSNNDKPHDLSLVASYKLGGRMVLSANFSYSTGRPITVPISKFSYDKTLSVLRYSDRNAYRIPDYHRLDLSLTIKPTLKKSKKYKGEWVISVYNVYGRKNAYSVYFDKSGQAKKLSILGTIFPSVTYNFSLNK